MTRKAECQQTLVVNFFADALQLAATLEWAQGNPVDREMVCLDERLRQAAQQEGFTVLP